MKIRAVGGIPDSLDATPRVHGWAAGSLSTSSAGHLDQLRGRKKAIVECLV